jgi:hypothetical protein
MSAPSLMGFGGLAVPAGNVFLAGLLVMVVGALASFQDLENEGTQRPAG